MAWNNLDDYAYCKGISYSRWAWEFIRRNPKYREEWEKELQILPHRLNTDPILMLMKDHILNGARAHSFNPLASPNAPNFGFLPSNPTNRWGLLAYFHPKNTNPIALQFTLSANDQLRSVGLYYLINLGESRIMFEIPGGTLGIGFDLSLPWAQQEKAAKFAFMQAQTEWQARGEFVCKKSARIPSEELLITYLRVLDAYDDGAFPQDIANVICADTFQPPIEKLHDLKEQACGWRDEKYSQLVAKGFEQDSIDVKSAGFNFKL